MTSSTDAISPSGCLLRPDNTILDCVQILEQTSHSTLFVIECGKVIGTVTDGDIRRGLLCGVELNSKVSQIMNRDFAFLPEHYTSEMAHNLLSKIGDVQIPILRKDGSIKSVYSSESNLNLDLPVVVMAGGLGKRLRPLTDNCPKPMIPINGTPMLEIIIKNLASLGLRKFYISVNYLKEKIVDHFGDGSAFNVSIDYIEENQPLGTAGSLSILPKIASENIIIMNGDVLTTVDYSAMISFFDHHNSDALMCVRSNSITVPFGVVSHEEHDLIAIKEKPTYDFMVNAGIYMLSSRLLKSIEPHYLDMPDFFMQLSANNYRVHVFPVHEAWYDVGRPSTLEEASRIQWQSAT